MAILLILIVGALGIAGAVAAALLAFPVFLAAWLVAAIFWLSVPLGALALSLLHRLTGGAWGVFARPTLEAAITTLPLSMVMFIPLIVTTGTVFPWTGLGVANGETTIHPGYFTVTTVGLRTADYFLLWLVLAVMAGIWGPAHRSAKAIGTIGLILWFAAAVLFAVDWVVSLESAWSIKTLPTTVIATMVMIGLTWIVLSSGFTRKDQDSGETSAHSDLARMMFAAVLFWVYLLFVQYLVVWTGNLPDQIGWYLERRDSTWQIIAWLFFSVMLVVAAGGFIWKQHAQRRLLMGFAGILFAAELLAAVWLVLPSVKVQDNALLWATPAALVGIGGIWSGVFIWALRRRLPH